MGSGLMIRSESYESCLIPQRNPKNVSSQNFVHTPNKRNVNLKSQDSTVARNGCSGDAAKLY